jgi:hypothetical protein
MGRYLLIAISFHAPRNRKEHDRRTGGDIDDQQARETLPPFLRRTERPGSVGAQQVLRRVLRWTYEYLDLPASAFHLNCARKQNVVFEVDVLVQVGLELAQSFIECLIADARIRRWCVAGGSLANRPEGTAR